MICSTWANHLNHGSYTYSYNTDRSSRSEIRHPDGSVTGAYNFIDEADRTHFIKYNSGPHTEIRVVSHDVEHNGQVVPFSKGLAADVEKARQSHHQFESALRNVLPEVEYKPHPPIFIRQVPNFGVHSVDVDAHELPPVYIRHIPSPVKHEPIVPIIDVASPHKLHVIQHSFLDAPVVSSKSYYEEIAHQGQQLFHKTLPFVHQQVIIQNTPKHHTIVRPPPLFTTQKQLVPTAPVFISPPPTAPVFNPQPTIIHEVPSALKKFQSVHPHHTGHPLLAADIPLTEEGLTPEVARARDQHFAAIAAVRATLPPH